MLIIDKSITKAILFDMDGTLVDNMHYHAAAWNLYLKKQGIHISEEEFLHNTAGKTSRDVIKMYRGDNLSDEEVAREVEEKEIIYREIYKPYIKEIPGLYDFIHSLKEAGIKRALATAADQKNIAFILENIHLEGMFDVLVGAEDITHSKPDPEVYIKASEKVHVPSSACLVFEDAISGVEAGKRAHMQVIGVLTTETKETLHMADACIHDYTQISIQ